MSKHLTPERLEEIRKWWDTAGTVSPDDVERLFAEIERLNDALAASHRLQIKLDNGIDFLRTAVETLRKENEELERKYASAISDMHRAHKDLDQEKEENERLRALLVRADSHVSWCRHRHGQNDHFGQSTASVLDTWLDEVAPITRPRSTQEDS